MSFADEILVIDDFSTDKTKEIAESLGARVIQHGMNGDWGKQQTFAIKNARYEWVLFVDADERISKPLAKEVCSVAEKVIKRPIGFDGKINSTIIMQPMAFCGRTT